MLKVSNLTFHYPNKGNTLDNFSLELQAGNIYGLLGKNGSGKTTLLYLMCGLLTPQKGDARIDGQNIRSRLPEVMQKIFLVPEELVLPNISLKNYIKVNACFYPDFSMESMRKNLSLFEMEEDIQLGKLSMGQKKKVFISFALASNTPYLLMDEPTNGLDIMAKSHFRKLITENMSDDKCILISTHQVRDIDQLLDNVIIINENRLLLHASVQDICRHLRCVQSSDCELARQALYVQPSAYGNLLLLPNPGQEDAMFNLELLYGATLTHPEEMAALFPMHG